MQVNASAVGTRNVKIHYSDGRQCSWRDICSVTRVVKTPGQVRGPWPGVTWPGTPALCNGAGDHLRRDGVLEPCSSAPTHLATLCIPRSTPHCAARNIPLFHGGERVARRDKINGLLCTVPRRATGVLSASTHASASIQHVVDALAALNCQLRDTSKLASPGPHTVDTCTHLQIVQWAFRDPTIRVYHITCTTLGHLPRHFSHTGKVRTLRTLFTNDIILKKLSLCVFFPMRILDNFRTRTISNSLELFCCLSNFWNFSGL